MSSETSEAKPLAANEILKAASHHLRGTIADELADSSTGAITEDAGQLTKFHGLYLQDDRDLRVALKKPEKRRRFPSCCAFACPAGRPRPRSGSFLINSQPMWHRPH